MFIVSQEYERAALLDFVGSRQQQSGIIWGEKDKSCVIITSGGKGGESMGYTDRWETDGSFTYIGQGTKGDQNPNAPGNSKLIKGERSILLFTTKEPTAEQKRKRGSRRKLFKFEGVFEVKQWNFISAIEGKRANDKLIEFSLIRAINIYISSSPIASINSSNTGEPDFSSLRNKVRAQGGKPTKGMITAREYIKRSNDIVQYAICRAKGICEYCRRPGPFKDTKGNLFLEVHHILRLSDDGPDSPENVAAICPNCHREAHFGKNKDTIKENLRHIVQKIEYILDNGIENKIQY